MVAISGVLWSGIDHSRMATMATCHMGRHRSFSTNFANIDFSLQNSHFPPMPLSAPQCRAARALLDWTQAGLAQRAAVSPGTVRGFEARRHIPHRASAAAIRQALEAAGIIFLEAGPGGGEGVRFTTAAD
jgi:DNA-binding XRE family transcriptional regulator